MKNEALRVCTKQGRDPGDPEEAQVLGLFLSSIDGSQFCFESLDSFIDFLPFQDYGHLIVDFALSLIGTVVLIPKI